MRKSVFTSEYDALREELRSARAKASLSQRELAGRLRVPHSWIAKVESGERRVDVVEFCWFFAACGLDPVDGLTRVAGQVKSKPRRKVRRGSR
jgi:transcriptional regulator with XRE-family HTH domain